MFNYNDFEECLAYFVGLHPYDEYNLTWGDFWCSCACIYYKNERLMIVGKWDSIRMLMDVVDRYHVNVQFIRDIMAKIAPSRQLVLSGCSSRHSYINAVEDGSLYATEVLTDETVVTDSGEPWMFLTPVPNSWKRDFELGKCQCCGHPFMQLATPSTICVSCAF